MTQAQYVTVWSGAGTHRVGEVIQGKDRIEVARSRGVVMLPTDERVYFSAAPGFAYRPWGRGYLYDAPTPIRGCPMMLAVGPEHPWVYWSVEVRRIRTAEGVVGQLRLIANGAAGAMSGGLAQDVRLAPIETYLAGPGQQGVVVSGRCSLGVITPGMLGLSVYGLCTNVAVIWSAVSCAESQIEVPDAVPTP